MSDGSHAIGGRARQPELVAQSGHLVGVPLLSAEFRRPGSGDPSLVPEGAVEVLVVHGAGAVGLLDDLGVQVLLKELPHLGPEVITLRAQPEVHHATSVGPNSASASWATPSFGSPRARGHAWALR